MSHGRVSICFLFCVWGYFLSVPFAYADLVKRDGTVRFSYEPLTLPGNEAMGLAGVSYLFDVGSSGYVGFTGFSAITGQRGGFFVGGLQTGLHNRLNNKWIIDGGLFVGGGGGGAAPQGGGLMLRPHMGILYDLGASRIGLGYSGVLYPNGSINSRQWYVSFERPVSIVLVDGTVDRITTSASDFDIPLKLAPVEIATVLRQYSPAAGSLNTSGVPLTTSSHLFGISLRHYRGEKLPRRFYFQEIAGSAGGTTDGYAEVLTGIGYQSRLWSNKSFWEGSVAVGAAGGGKVDTGGGLIIRGELGAGYYISPALIARIGAGYMNAPDGHYQANTLTAQLAYQWQLAGSHRYGSPVSEHEVLEVRQWRLRAVNQVYASPAWKGTFRANTISLMGIKADMFVSPKTYLTGQGLAAYEGGAGGYAVGMLGIGKILNLGSSDKFGATLELAIGAAGGGGVDVGSGIVVQPSVGMTYQIRNNISLDLNYSHINALSGALNSGVYEVGMSYRFNTAGKSY